MPMICLKHNGAEMTIALRGAEMQSYRDADGREHIWCGDPAVWKGRAPVLFPAIGALGAGGTTIAGEPYAVPRHGFVRERMFEVTEQGDDYVTLTLHEDAQTKEVYPFDFALSVTYRFIPGGFETRFVVENHTGRSMPFMIGGHPAFCCPMNEGEAFEDYVIRFETQEGPTTPLCVPNGRLHDERAVEWCEDGRTLPLDHSVFDAIDTYIFTGLRSRYVDLVHKQNGKGLRFSFDMPVLAVWTMPGKRGDYVCIEPWQGCPAYEGESGRFEDKPYHATLGAGEVFTCGYKMELI